MRASYTAYNPRVRIATALGLAGLVGFAVTAVPAISLGQPVVANEPPSRWVLTGGTVVVGTKVSEEPEYYVVQTSSGVVRIRKVDLARIELQGAVAPAPTAPAPAPAAPAPATPAPAPRDESSGAGTFLRGLGLFGASYGIAAIIGVIVVAAGEPEGNLLLIPVAGPVLFFQDATLNLQSVLYVGLDVVAQAVGLGMMIFGMATYDAADATSLRLAPRVTSTEQGLWATLSF